MLLAVPFGALDDVVKVAGDAVAGKTVVDVTNALHSIIVTGGRQPHRRPSWTCARSGGGETHRPEQVASVVAFLFTDGASAINGSTIPVEDGFQIFKNS